jgi:hypothetical protein
MAKYVWQKTFFSIKNVIILVIGELKTIAVAK